MITQNYMAPISRLPEELLALIFDSFQGPGPHSIVAQLRFAAVCQRFRRIAIRDAYQTIISDDSQLLRLPHLFDVIPFNGNLVHKLDLWIQPVSSSTQSVGRPTVQLQALLDGLARVMPHLSHLCHLILRVFPATQTLDCVPFVGDMRSSEVASLVKCFETLNPRLDELELHELTWKDAAKALCHCATGPMPNLYRLVLGLWSPSQPADGDATFMNNFPGVTDLALPDSLCCPSVAWFSRAFGSAKIEHLEIMDRPSPIPVYLGGWPTDDAIETLCTSSSSSLQTIKLLDVTTFPSKKVAKYLMHVTSIFIAYADFEAIDLDEFVGPFASLPALATLRLMWCQGLSPGMLAKWLTPREPRINFPALERLEVEGVDEDRIWRKSEADELVKNCRELGIEASLSCEFI